MRLVSKYAGRCKGCGGPIAVGDEIDWTKETGAKHAACVGTMLDVPQKTNVIKAFCNFQSIAELFARTGIQYPKLHFRHTEGPIVISRAGEKSAYQGALYVTNGRDWYGRIEKNGDFTKSKNCTDWVVGFLQLFAQNPVEVAAQHGRENGYCCFCNSELIDEKSTHVGYGPVCAKHWGMPWGKKEVRSGTCTD